MNFKKIMLTFLVFTSISYADNHLSSNSLIVSGTGGLIASSISMANKPIIDQRVVDLTKILDKQKRLKAILEKLHNQTPNDYLQPEIENLKRQRLIFEFKDLDSYKRKYLEASELEKISTLTTDELKELIAKNKTEIERISTLPYSPTRDYLIKSRLVFISTAVIVIGLGLKAYDILNLDEAANN